MVHTLSLDTAHAARGLPYHTGGSHDVKEAAADAVTQIILPAQLHSLWCPQQLFRELIEWVIGHAHRTLIEWRGR